MGDINEHQEKNIEEPQEVAAEEAVANTPDSEVGAAFDPEVEGSEGEDSGLKEGFSNPLEALAAENTQLEEQVNDLKDKLLRTVAEMENLRRRTQKDVADARNFSISGFARDVLGVSDNLRRAIEAVAAEDRDHAGLKSLIEGVEMTERELHKSLEKNGVRKISPLKEKFDPNFHQAMFEVANPEVPNNTVIEVVQDGYVIGERVLRPAMVGVAKGGPKTGKPDITGDQQRPEGESA